MPSVFASTVHDNAPLAAFPTQVIRERHRFDALIGKLNAVSPLSVLLRGYAIAFSRTRRRRKPVLDSAQVGIGEQIEVQLKRGAVACTVDRKTLGIETTWPEQMPRDPATS